jgi:acyl-CoA thioesterase-1
MLSIVIWSCKGDAKQSIPEIDESIDKLTQMQENVDEKTRTILFFGNSLTAGFGLDKSESFPSLIQDRIDSLGMDYQVVNAGLSGETSSGGASRIDWVLQQKVDVFVLELGANDMLRGLELSSTEANLRQILTSVKDTYPEAKIIICGMMSPPNMGPDYVKGFTAIYPKLAEEFNAGFIPFFLDGVAGNEDLNLPDGKHPNAEGQKIVRENIWDVLKDYL